MVSIYPSLLLATLPPKMLVVGCFRSLHYFDVHSENWTYVISYLRICEEVCSDFSLEWYEPRLAGGLILLLKSQLTFASAHNVCTLSMYSQIVCFAEMIALILTDIIFLLLIEDL